MMWLMETVEIREERADSHSSHKPKRNAHRGLYESDPSTKHAFRSRKTIEN